jgi:hypothetical protein
MEWYGDYFLFRLALGWLNLVVFWLNDDWLFYLCVVRLNFFFYP